MPIHKTIHQFTVCIVLYKKVQFVRKFLWYLFNGMPLLAEWRKTVDIQFFGGMYAQFGKHASLYFCPLFPIFWALCNWWIFHLSSKLCQKYLVTKYFGTISLITMKEWDLALEKLVQDPSLKNFLYCMRPGKCFYMYKYYQTNNDHFQVKKLHLWNLKYGLFYGNLIPLPAVVIRLVGNNNHHFRWVIHDSANIILFLLKGCCAEV